MITTTLPFKAVKEIFQQNAKELLQSAEQLFVADVDKDSLWEAYINSFPESIRQEFNCNSCRSFIKQYGNLVVIDNHYRVRSIWELRVDDPTYQRVFNNLDRLVCSAPIRDLLVVDTQRLGTDSNVQMLEGGETIRWHHLSLQLPRQFVTKGLSDTLASIRGERRAQKEVLKRSLDELTITATQTALELIASNSIYRGDEFRGLLQQFLQLQNQYAELPQWAKDNFCWLMATKVGGSLSRIRNTAIGTFLIDLSADLDLNEAVNRFERVMAPANYKRPTPVFTKSMVEAAERKVAELGLSESLSRRHATMHDLTVNNLLFVDRSSRMKTASIFDSLKEDVVVNPKKFDKVQEVFLETFINDILPTVQSVELLVENKHQSRLVSLIAPANPDAPSLFKWDNGFSWSYSGAYADSVRERVKKAGGEVDGKLRLSLAWSNYDDLDLHLFEPNGHEISFRDKRSYYTGGQLDVDMNAGGGNTREPVENIFYPHDRPLPQGTFKVVVNQFSQREQIDVGFTVEIEYEGNIQTFEYTDELKNKENVVVAIFSYDNRNGIQLIRSIEESTKVRSREFWGLKSNHFQKVNAMMFSPNHWDTKIGNKHLFLILDQCRNDEPKVRGFFNEFLKEELTPHRKVFEALGERMNIQNNVGEHQLSGVGFSLTQASEFIVRVKGQTERVLKVVV